MSGFTGLMLGVNVSRLYISFLMWVSEVFYIAQDQIQNAVLLSNSEVLISGAIQTGGDYRPALMRIDKNGVPLNTFYFSDAVASVAYSVACTTAGGNYYLAWLNASNYLCFAKLNSSFSVQWQKQLIPAAGAFQPGLSIVYAEGYPCVVVENYNGGSYMRIVVLNDGDGSVAITKEFGPNVYVGKAITDGTYIYVSGQSYNSAYNFNIFKITPSTLTVSWANFINTSTYMSSSYDVKATSSGSVYVSGIEEHATGYYALLAKFDSSGTKQWIKRLGSTGDSGYFNAIVLDGLENIYAGGENGGTPCIVKYDSSGTLQWQRTFTNISQPRSMVYDAGTSTIGFTTSNFELIKLPIDGTGTGTYTSAGPSGSTCVYASSSVSETTNTLSSGGSVYTVYTKTESSTTTTLTAASATVAKNIKGIA